MKFCENCGKELFDEAVMCPQCGASQMPKAPEAQPQTVAEEKAVKPESAVNEFFEKKKKSKKPLIIIIAAIVALAVAAAVVFLVIKPFGEDESKSLILGDVIAAYDMTEAEQDIVDELYAQWDTVWEDLKAADKKSNYDLMMFVSDVYSSWETFYEEHFSDFCERINAKTSVSQDLRDCHTDMVASAFILETATGYGKDHLNNAVALINSFSNLFYAEELISAKEVEDFLAPKTSNVIDGLNEYLNDNSKAAFEGKTSGNTTTGTIPEYGYEIVIEERDGIVSSIKIAVSADTPGLNMNTEYSRMCYIACAMTFQKPELRSDMYNTLIVQKNDFALGGWEYETYHQDNKIVFSITLSD